MSEVENNNPPSETFTSIQTALATATSALDLNNQGISNLGDVKAHDANNHDIGDSTHTFRTVYVGTSVVVPNGANETTLAFVAATGHRVATFQNATGTVSLLGVAEDFSGVKTFSASPLFTDGAVNLGDATHRVGSVFVGTAIVFQTAVGANKQTVSCTPTGTRTLALPDASGTAALTSQVGPALIMFGNSVDVANTAEFLAPCYLDAAADAVENARLYTIPADGRILGMYVQCLTNTLAAAEHCVVTLRRGAIGGAMGDTTMTVDLLAGVLDGSDNAHPLEVHAGDRLSIHWVPNGGGHTCTYPRVVLRYVADHT